VSHKGIVKLIEDTAKSLADDMQFSYGRASDVNMLRDKRYPFIALDPLRSSAEYAVDGTSNYSKSWIVNMAFYFLDKEESTQDEYRKLLDDADILVDQFINKLNFYSLKSDSIVITGISQDPVIKVMADIITGYIISFTITANDDFNYCYDC
jgi:hypothetical protein